MLLERDQATLLMQYLRFGMNDVYLPKVPPVRSASSGALGAFEERTELFDFGSTWPTHNFSSIVELHVNNATIALDHGLS